MNKEINMSITILACINQEGSLSSRDISLYQENKDQERLCELIKGHVLVMGRVTYERLKNEDSKLLRVAIPVVITHDKTYKDKSNNGTIVYNTIEPIIVQSIKTNDDDHKKTFVLGGKELCKQFINYADKLELTVVHDAQNSNEKFPMSSLEQFELTNKEEFQGVVNFDFLTYERKKETSN